VYNRRVLAGEFPIVNRHLLRDLIERGLWNALTRLYILAHKGSIQNIPGMPDDLKALYKTVWEIKQRTVIDMAADRGAYICQSQSLNLFIAEPSVAKLTSAHFYSWKKGLKTGMYYLRAKPKADAIAFTIDQVALAEASKSGLGIQVGFAVPAAVLPVVPGSEEEGVATVVGDATPMTPAFPIRAMSSPYVSAGGGGGAAAAAAAASGGGSGSSSGAGEVSIAAFKPSLGAAATAAASAPALKPTAPKGSSPGDECDRPTISEAYAGGITMTTTATAAAAAIDAAAVTPAALLSAMHGKRSAAEIAADAAAKKAAIRAAMAAGSIVDDGTMCLNCSA